MRTITLHPNTGDLIWEDQVPTVDTQLRPLSTWLSTQKGTHTTDQAETKFNIFHLLNKSNNLAPPLKAGQITLEENDNTHRYTGTTNCTLCSNNSNHTLRWSASSIFGNFTAICNHGAKRHSPLTPWQKNFLFNFSINGPDHTLPKAARPQTGTPDGDEKLTPDDLRDTPLPKTGRRKASPAPIISDKLRILQWNTDKRCNSTIHEIISLAKEHEADVICLQEVENMHWINSLAFLSEQGYNLYSHKKVAILTNSHTLENRIINNWDDPDHDTMFISIDTPSDGTILLVNAYIHDGVDKMKTSSPSLLNVENHHSGILRNILETKATHNIIVMDGNETSDLKDRCSIHSDGSHHFSGSKANPSTLGSYTGLIDAHSLANPSFYTEGINLERYSFYTPSQRNMTIHSKIDWTLISKSLSPNLHCCSHLPVVEHWGGGTKKFHKAVYTELHLADNINLGTDNPPVTGSSLPIGPDLRNLTPLLEVEISKQVDQELASKWKNIRQQLSGRDKKEVKRDKLGNLLKNTLIRISTQILGKARAPTKPGKNKGKNPKTNTERAHRLFKRVGQVLRLTNSIYFDKHHAPPLNLQDSLIDTDSTSLRDAGFTIPDNEKAWRLWWPYRHNILKNTSATDTGTEDINFLKDPKQTYKFCCKPKSSSAISSLHKNKRTITSDGAICRELTNFVKGICEDEYISQDEKHHKPTRHTPAYTTNEHLKNLLYNPDFTEMGEIVRSLDSNSSAGLDTLAPRLIKIVCTRSWSTTSDKPKADINEERRANRFSVNLRNHAKKIGLDSPPKEWSEPSPTVTGLTLPTRFLSLLTKFTSLCFETKDLPTVEKMSVITPLPKKGGQVRSTDNIRPIAVGQIIARIINKLVARRLSNKLRDHNILDPAQHAFLPGLSIHEPINTLVHCLSDYKRKRNTQEARNCFVIYYDITKAYDCVRWSSIEAAMERLGIDPTLIDFVMNTLTDSTMAMKTNVPGRITDHIKMNKAIKQGCPLAPLLFALVMDELHVGYRKFKGYTLDGTKVCSRGYCDDTLIISDDLDDLKQMNLWSNQFMIKHSLDISVSKTMVTGRDSSGQALVEPIHWAGQTNALKILNPGSPTKYLGVMITFDLDWGSQIKKMNGFVMNIAARLSAKSITLLQGSMLIKTVLSGKMEIGLRHAQISTETLIKWDEILARSITKRCDLSQRQIHSSSINIILGICSLADSEPIAKTIQIMENITRNHELTTHYRSEIKKASNLYTSLVDTIITKDTNKHTLKTKPTDNEPLTLTTLKALVAKGISIQPNTDHVPVEKTTPDSRATKETFTPHPDLKWDRKHKHSRSAGWGPSPTVAKGPQPASIIPYQDTYHPWTTKEKTWSPTTQAHIGTDGSTYPGRPSAAALIYITKDIKSNELWKTAGTYWKLPLSDNHIAEMAAINKALRSLPVDVNITVWTDSLSSIQSIDRHMQARSNLLKEAARPYLIAIKRIIDIRSAHGASTDINHVKSHTGERDLPSLGNSEADRYAKYEALRELEPGEKPNDIAQRQNDLPFIVSHIEIANPPETKDKHKRKATQNSPDPHKNKPARAQVLHHTIHGDIRKSLKTQARKKQIAEWSSRLTRGHLIRTHTKAVLQLLDDLWMNPTSALIKFFIDILNRADRKSLEGDDFKTVTCTNCSRRHKADTEHRLIHCPAMADIWNKADDLIWSALGLEDTLHGIATPWGKIENKTVLDLCDLYNIHGVHTSTQITRATTRCADWINDHAKYTTITDGTNPAAAAAATTDTIATNKATAAANAAAAGAASAAKTAAAAAKAATIGTITPKGNNNRKRKINNSKGPPVPPPKQSTKAAQAIKRQRTMMEMWRANAPVTPLRHGHPAPRTPPPPNFKSTDQLARHYVKGNITQTQQQWTNCDFLYSIAAKYLHTENTLNTDAINYSGNTHWFSTDPTEIALGAKGGDPAKFINGNYTWVNLSDDTKTNTHPDNYLLNPVNPNTRMVILTYHNLEDTNTHGMKARTLATFPPFSIEINHKTAHPFTLNREQTRAKQNRRKKRKCLIKTLDQVAARPQTDTTRALSEKLKRDLAAWEEITKRSTLNEKRLYLHILDYKTPNDIDIKAFHEALNTHPNSHGFHLNDDDKHIAAAGLSHNVMPHTQHRTNTNHKPSLLWYRHVPNRQLNNSQVAATLVLSQLKETDTLAASLGLAPDLRTQRKWLSLCSHHPSTLSASTLAKINKILLKAAQTAYARLEHWERIIRHDYP